MMTEPETDFEMLRHTFGEEYFVLRRILKNKAVLTQEQKQELLHLIGERNHFDILSFVNKIRN